MTNCFLDDNPKSSTAKTTYERLQEIGLIVFWVFYLIIISSYISEFRYYFHFAVIVSCNYLSDGICTANGPSKHLTSSSL